MTIRSDSFSSAAEVTAFTRHLLDGQSAYNSTTRPTVTELEKFIDRASSHINVALATYGFTPSNVYNNSTAKLLMDDWVTNKAARYVEVTQRGTGYGDGEGSRLATFDMGKDAFEFVSSMAYGLINLGISQGVKMSDGLQYTGLDVQSDRADPDDVSLEQPKFKRGQWDNT